MRRLTLAIIITAPMAVVGCHTITEELPTRPGPVIVGGGTPAPAPAPIVVPVPVPSATPPPQSAPPPAPPRPVPNPAPNPGPTAAPAPNPAPPNPGGGGGGGGGGQIPDNTNPATRLGAKVYFVECNGQTTGGENSSTAQVGCRIHYDVTPKDANNQHTQVRNIPRWTFSPADIADGVSSKTEFTPTIRASGRGTLTAYAEADGIRSNTVTIRID